MTARTSRRRRSTVIAAVAAVVALLVTGGLAYAGAMALWNSTDGDEAGGDVPELAFPATPTALLAGVDDTGALASLSVVVVQPDGAGGTVVSVPVSADATSGEGDERLPIAETFALEGPDALASEVEIALNLSLDDVEVADADRIAALLAPVGDVEVDLPADVTDHDGEVVAAAGRRHAGAGGARRRPHGPRSRRPGRRSARRGRRGVGGGRRRPRRHASAPPAADPPTLEGILGAARAGPLSPWTLTSAPIDDARNPRGVDVALLDRAELAIVFGQIAPGRVSAPNPGLSFRVVAEFSDAQLGDRGWTNADIAYRAVSQLLFLRGNVISVDTTPGSAPGETVIAVADTGMNTAGRGGGLRQRRGRGGRPADRRRRRRAAPR